MSATKKETQGEANHRPQQTGESQLKFASPFVHIPSMLRNRKSPGRLQGKWHANHRKQKCQHLCQYLSRGSSKSKEALGTTTRVGEVDRRQRC